MKDYLVNDPSIGRRMFGGDHNWKSKVVLLHDLKNDSGKLSSFKGANIAKRQLWFRKHVQSIACMVLLIGFFVFLDSLMVSISDSINLQYTPASKYSKGLKVVVSVLVFWVHLYIYFSMVLCSAMSVLQSRLKNMSCVQ